jgi:phage portal protein BeeE
LDGKSPLLSAEKAIANLIAVYEARGAIYVKRGALGLLVSRKSDASGSVALTDDEKKQVREDYNNTYGVTGNRDLTAITDQPMDYLRIGMSIEELLPFDETLADAAAIYACIGVPLSLMPRKDQSTYANQAADEKSLYINTVIPLAKKYALAYTQYFRLMEQAQPKYIDVDFSHVAVLQDDRSKEATAAKTEGDTWKVRFDNGLCSLNEWITAFNGTPGTDPMYSLKKYEMDETQLGKLNPIIKNMNDNANNAPKDNTAQGSSSAN